MSVRLIVILTFGEIYLNGLTILLIMYTFAEP